MIKKLKKINKSVFERLFEIIWTVYLTTKLIGLSKKKKRIAAAN